MRQKKKTTKYLIIASTIGILLLGILYQLNIDSSDDLAAKVRGGGPKGSGGGQSVLIVMLDNVPTPSGIYTLPQSLSYYEDYFLTGAKSVPAFWGYTSRGKISLSGDIIKINYNNALWYPSIQQVQPIANPLIAAQGVNISNYDYIAYVSDGYDWGSQQGYQYDGNILSVISQKTLAHEIGHALGLDHSYWFGQNGGDITCTMGQIYVPLNAVQMIKQNYLPKNDIIKPRSSGSYTLAPLHPSGKVLRIGDLVVSKRDFTQGPFTGLAYLPPNQVYVQSYANIDILANLNIGQSYTANGVTITNNNGTIDILM